MKPRYPSRPTRAWALPIRYLLVVGLLAWAPARSWAATIKLEAESAVLTGVGAATDIAGYSGTGYAWNFVNTIDNVTLTFQATAGQYDLVILELTNALGQRVASLRTALRAGPNTCQLPIAGLRARSYQPRVLVAGQPAGTQLVAITE